MKGQAAALGALAGDGSQLGAVHLLHVEEPGAELRDIGATHGGAARQHDLIVDDHDVAGLVAQVHAPGGIGQDHRPAAQQLEQPDGRRQLREVIPLVGVEPPGHAHHLLAGDGAADQLPGVGSHGGTQEIGDVPIGDHHRVFHLGGKGAQGRAQDNADLRLKVQLFPDIPGAFLEKFIGIFHGMSSYYILY